MTTQRNKDRIQRMIVLLDGFDDLIFWDYKKNGVLNEALWEAARQHESRVADIVYE